MKRRHLRQSFQRLPSCAFPRCRQTTGIQDPCLGVFSLCASVSVTTEELPAPVPHGHTIVQEAQRYWHGTELLGSQQELGSLAGTVQLGWLATLKACHPLARAPASLLRASFLSSSPPPGSPLGFISVPLFLPFLGSFYF